MDGLQRRCGVRVRNCFFDELIVRKVNVFVVFYVLHFEL